MTKERTRRPIPENDEFSLNRLLDDDLPANEASSWRERLEAEPGLRETFTSLERLDHLLTECKSDQPSVDYAQLRANVMRAVSDQQAKRRLIRFPSWLQVGVPLAVAAGIVLLIWVQPLFVHREGTPSDSATPNQVAVIPSPADSELPASGEWAEASHAIRADRSPGSDDLVVRIHRVGQEDDELMHKAQVRFTRSANLAEYVRQEDEARSNQPSRYFFLRTSQSVSYQEVLAEAPPL